MPNATRVAHRWLSATKLNYADLTPELRKFVVDVTKGIRDILDRSVRLQVDIHKENHWNSLRNTKVPGVSVVFRVVDEEPVLVVLYEFEDQKHILINEAGRKIPVATPAQVVEAMKGILYDDMLEGGSERADARTRANKAIFAELQEALHPWDDTINVYPRGDDVALEVEILPLDFEKEPEWAAIQRAAEAVFRKYQKSIAKTDVRMLQNMLYLYVAIATDPR